MKSPLLESPVAQELQLAQSETASVREPEVGVDLVPWAVEADVPPAANHTQPLWLFELETARVEEDPFEALVRSGRCTANGLAPGAEPTIKEPTPLGAVGPWWIEPPRPSPVRQTRKPTIEVPVATPPQWRSAAPRRSSPRPAPPLPSFSPPPRRNAWARVASVAGVAVLCGAIGVTLLAGRQSAASTDLVVPPPPERVEAVLPAKVEPERAPPAVETAPRGAAKDLERQKLLKRVRAAKKWAAESWPEPVVAQPAPEPEPVEALPSRDELKRPQF
mgnify:CR=1 FL=1